MEAIFILSLGCGVTATHYIYDKIVKGKK